MKENYFRPSELRWWPERERERERESSEDEQSGGNDAQIAKLELNGQTCTNSSKEFQRKARKVARVKRVNEKSRNINSY